MKKWVLVFFVIICTASLVVGCSSLKFSKTEKPVEVEEKLEKEPGNLGVKQDFPLTITDAIGNKVTLETKPTKIISLMPSVTETLFAIGAGNQVIGRTDWCNYPEEALELPSVGQMEFDLEKLIALKPDLVLSHEGALKASSHLLDQVRDAGIKVIVVNNSDSFEGVYQAIQFIATVTGHVENGTLLVNDLKTAFTEIEKKAAEIPTDKRKKVWIEVDPGLFTTGKGTFMHEILETINAINSAEKAEGWVKFSEEEVVVMNPDVIVTTYGDRFENPKQQILERAGWDSVTAVKNEQIFDFNSDTLTKPGPRLAEGVEQLAKLIYPEVFNE